MASFTDSIIVSVRWSQTLIAPLIIGLFLGGVIYSFIPNPFGFKLSVVIASAGLITGVIVLIIRIIKHKGPASFYSGKNGK